MKSNQLSFFLLKQDFNANNALKEGNHLKEISSGSLPQNAKLFLADTELNQPWWKSYLGITQDLSQGLRGAILFIPCGNRVFAITFGNVYHNLKDESYEYDFGLLTTLNSIDNTALKSTDILQPENALRRRIQTPKSSDLTFFDFDKDASIIKRLTGCVKEEYKSLFTNTTGANNLRITTKKTLTQLSDLCQELLNIYKKDDYKTSFPGLHNIRPIKDPSKLNELNNALIEKIKDKSSDIILTVPDITDYSNISHIKFSQKKDAEEHANIDISSFYGDKKIDIQSICIDSIKSEYSLILLDDNGQEKNSFSLFKSLIFDFSNSSGEVFHLCDGNWYQVESKYLGALNTEIDKAFEQYVLPDYPIHTKNESEGDYNTAVAQKDQTMICLDTKNIAPDGETQIEPCDLYTVKDGCAHYIHVKKGTRSATLSHLFNQGVNSIILINANDSSAEKMKNLIQNSIGNNSLKEYIDPVENKKGKVVYAIISNKDANKKSQLLPLFSRISLKRAMQSLKSMNIGTAVTIIKDTLSK